MASDRPLERICVRVFASDYTKANEVARAMGVPVNVIIREALHNYLRHLTDLERKAIDTLPPPRANSNIAAE